MPRTASFDLSEVKTTSPKDPQPVYHSILNSHTNSKNVPQEPARKKEKCCHCSCGWSAGLFMSACSITFLVMLCLFPEYFISHLLIVKRESHHLLVKKGYLRVYPNLPKRNVEITDRVPGVYVIDPSSEYVQTEIVSNIENALKDYKDVKNDTYPPNPYILCWLNNPLQAETPCFFDKNWVTKECSKENDYGYKSIRGLYSPCVLLRLEETEDWTPQIFKVENVSPIWISEYDPSHISVGCYSKDPHKKLEARVNPSKGFPIDFFPQKFFEERLYLPPMVMVQFIDLEVGEDVSVECWLRVQNAWLLKDNGVVNIHFRHQKKRTLNLDEIIGNNTEVEMQTFQQNYSTPFTVQ